LTGGLVLTMGENKGLMFPIGVHLLNATMS